MSYSDQWKDHSHSNQDGNASTLGLANLEPPAELTARLRVAASRVALQRRRTTSVHVFLQHALDRVSLVVDNLMKPYALPFAGGLVSTMFLFGMLAPQLSFDRTLTSDVPTGLTTEATLESSFSMNLGDQDVVVEVDIDEQGRVAGYSIPRGQAWASDPALIKGLENTLLCTKFYPATFFGKPASGKTRITLRRSRLDVIG